MNQSLDDFLHDSLGNLLCEEQDDDEFEFGLEDEDEHDRFEGWQSDSDLGSS